MAKIKRIFLECTHTYETSINTGIQRVVRNIINNSEYISKEIGIECKPVIVKHGHFLAIDKITENIPLRANIISFLKKVYRKLHPISQRIPFFNRIEQFLFSEPGYITIIIHAILDILLFPRTIAKNMQKNVVAQKGDVLLLMDSSWSYPIWPAVKKAKGNDAIIGLVVYDIISITHPEFFPASLPERFKRWFNQAVENADFFIAISQTIRDEIKKYAEVRCPSGNWNNRFESFQLGSVIDNASNEGKVRDELKKIFENSNGPCTYLAVGTIEPRKNHKYLLDTFKEVWVEHPQARLCIVGRIGWLCDELVSHIKSHSKYKKCLFMFNDLSDTELEFCYEKAGALVFPSFAEGFGLPIVEALYHGLPVFASDISIHREVGKDFCTYFDISKPDSLAEIIINIEKTGEMPGVRMPEEYNLPSWKDSCKELLTKTIELGKKNAR
jgi:alpha-1,2-rhamnosyltransferase